MYSNLKFQLIRQLYDNHVVWKIMTNATCKDDKENSFRGVRR